MGTLKQVPISILIQRFFSHKDVQNVIKARGCATTKLTMIFGSFILKSNTSINFHSLMKRNNGKEKRANKQFFGGFFWQTIIRFFCVKPFACQKESSVTI